MQTAKKLTIVGGGAAGWMTAIYLNKYFNSQQINFAISVIESPDIGIIGVGEATVHSIRYFFAAMGLDEAELMRRSHGTLKTGILFRNWMQPVQGQMHEYFHPFEQQQLGQDIDISSSWLLTARYKQERYDEGVSLSAHLIKSLKSPKAERSLPYQGVVPYGYHLDAVLMARYLREHAIDAGVNYIEDTISRVITSDGNISAVCSCSNTYTADVFIDATGFSGLLIESLQKDNWQSFADALPCNRAVALQREHGEGYTPKPYTTATALSNGWVWQIDLSSRQGTGYVYDGNRLTPEQAEQELREFLGPESKVLKTRHLHMKVGCRKTFWLGNCIAIGLSGGFIEPLESTGLHLINLGVRLLGTHLNTGVIAQPVRDAYNKTMNGFYDDLKQFIVLHYCLTNRDDTEFWRNAAKTAATCDGLVEKLALWQHKICEYHDLAGGFATTFTDENYRFVLYGMQHYPALQMQLGDAAQKPFSLLQQRVQQALNMTMTHQQYLAGIGG
ncbi:tryptophan 7-halogenase [Rheinheimera baltica]|uniref:tryptophan halogenase family protein n=1 Tax=Rheinheimera baltica TaxID=67576 RepID=UPI00273D98DD|nr:tryptophan halogenase family protein [Rheinheimera baltica]MDP5142828.1 tryptophan 7-halogenase [Rheinheimera baltica]